MVPVSVSPSSPLSFKDITALELSCMAEYGGPVFPYIAFGGYSGKQDGARGGVVTAPCGVGVVLFNGAMSPSEMHPMGCVSQRSREWHLLGWVSPSGVVSPRGMSPTWDGWHITQWEATLLGVTCWDGCCTTLCDVTQWDGYHITQCHITWWWDECHIAHCWDVTHW